MVDLGEDEFLQNGGKLFTAVWRTSEAASVDRKWHLLDITVQRRRQSLINKMRHEFRSCCIYLADVVSYRKSAIGRAKTRHVLIVQELQRLARGVKYYIVSLNTKVEPKDILREV